MSWKSKLRKIGGIAAAVAPFALAPFTAGSSLALLPMTGAGATSGALLGGKKGALIGGGAGALGSLAMNGGIPMPGGGGGGGNTPGGGGGTNTGNTATGALGFLGKLKDAGIDPTRLGLGALSLLQGPDQQFRQSYGGKGRVDPYAALQGRSDQISSLISQLQNQPKFEQHAPPAPITIPGIPFQIGGGLNGPLAGLEPNPDQRKFVA